MDTNKGILKRLLGITGLGRLFGWDYIVPSRFDLTDFASRDLTHWDRFSDKDRLEYMHEEGKSPRTNLFYRLTVASQDDGSHEATIRYQNEQGDVSDKIKVRWKETPSNN